MDGTEKLLEEIKVWETEVISEELSGNIVKLAYAKGRLNGLQIVYAFEQAKIAKLEGWLKLIARYSWPVIREDIKNDSAPIFFAEELSAYIKAIEEKP